MQWIKKLTEGLKKSANNISDNVATIFSGRKIDEEMLEELEEALIMADFGPKIAAAIIDDLRDKKLGKEASDEVIKEFVASHIAEIIAKNARKLKISFPPRPFVILVAGVNGSGKTTTIGKMAHDFIQQGYKVKIAACDTYRAAAVAQLEEWCKRSGSEIIKGEGREPASVAYQAFEKAIEDDSDILLIDTAGRLHNKQHLMEELSKIIRVIEKLDLSAPHENILVLDATTGQNAIEQVRIFSNFMKISGIITTKLDGTARGGVVINISEQFKLPVYMIGIGEKIEDLREFEPKEFASALIGAK